MDSLRVPPRGVSPGTRLNGIYEIDQMIGAGGMGEIYKSHEIQTGTTVAIKMLLPEMAENDAALALFRKEASALHYLMHDAIVRYYVFTVEPVLQRPYLAMEFVDGRSLSDIIDEGPLAFDAILKLMRRVASGLHAAHQRGITHRDVSPDNIIIPHGDVAKAKIIDFGIARSTEAGDATVIGTGFAGKHNYVSPEQVGLFGGDVSARSDIYSFGLVLFQALTGKKLDMAGSQFQLVEKRRRVPDLGAVDMRIRPLLEQMLQPDPAMRPASMAEVENWSVGSSATSSKLKSQSKTASSADGDPPSSRKWVIGAIAAGLLILAGGGGAYYRFVWSIPVAKVAPPVASLNQNPLAVPPPVPAARPPAEDPVSRERPVTAPNRAEAARRFVEQYSGGDCFYVVPVAISQSAAVLEGFGASTAPFDSLDKTFAKAQGFEASIGVRQVTQPQCPAVRFLNQLRSERARAPRISLGSVDLKNGETLSGMIENFANRVVELLLVSDNGSVQNVSYLLKPGTDSVSFAIALKRNDLTAPSAPQLIVAVASPRVLDSLRQPAPLPADQFFFQALSEAQRLNLTLSASARYVQLYK